MSYSGVASLAHDNDILMRVTACAALEGIESPWAWVAERNWLLAAQPGWGDAYSYAMNQARPEDAIPIGRDESVISDGQILAAVQGMIQASE